jgi:tubulin polyglutamylase TTLL1
MLVTQYGNMRGYFFEDGYLRTSSKEYSLDNFSNKYIHLTNDAIQQYSEDYGKFENSNKLSYADFQKYLESPEFLTTSKYAVPGGFKFYRDILP